MSLEARVIGYLKDQLVGHEVEPEGSLVGLLDSVAVMELVVWIESTFRVAVEIDDIHPDNFSTARKIAGYIEKHATVSTVEGA